MFSPQVSKGVLDIRQQYRTTEIGTKDSNRLWDNRQ